MRHGLSRFRQSFIIVAVTAFVRACDATCLLLRADVASLLSCIVRLKCSESARPEGTKRWLTGSHSSDSATDGTGGLPRPGSSSFSGGDRTDFSHALQDAARAAGLVVKLRFRLRVRRAHFDCISSVIAFSNCRAEQAIPRRPSLAPLETIPITEVVPSISARIGAPAYPKFEKHR